MSIKNILADALGAYVSQLVTGEGVKGLSGISEGRFPKWITPIIVPRGATLEEAEGEAPIFDPPFRLTGLGFALGFSALLWYAAREMDKAALGELGAEMQDFWETKKQPELFRAKRELRVLETEDMATSDDPITACMERRGYTQEQMDRLGDRIAEKTTIDMFDDKPAKLTSSETKFQDDIQDCIDHVKNVFGSMEAAGYEDCDCD